MIFFSVNGCRFSLDFNRILILSTKMKFEDPFGKAINCRLKKLYCSC